jgi:hypothetical protein
VKILSSEELIDIKYTDLIASPTKTLKQIYDKFKLGR